MPSIVLVFRFEVKSHESLIISSLELILIQSQETGLDQYTSSYVGKMVGMFIVYCSFVLVFKFCLFPVLIFSNISQVGPGTVTWDLC